MKPFSVFIPLGPRAIEEARLHDLIESLFYYEPSVSLLVIVAEDLSLTNLLDNIAPRGSCTIAVIAHPRPKHELNYLGGLCTADLIALSYIHRHQPSGFTLKMDSDSLVIRAFSEKLQTLIEANHCIGTVGTLGKSCRRSSRSFDVDHKLAEFIPRALRIGLSENLFAGDERTLVEKCGITTELQETVFRRLCKLLAPLLSKPYTGTHCQGGAYAISEEMKSRLASSGILEDPSLWLELEFAEDQMMGMLSVLVDLEPIDCSAPGEIFGVQSRGLAYPLPEMLAYGYSIIHSVKNDERHPEPEIREWFRNLRTE